MEQSDSEVIEIRSSQVVDGRKNLAVKELYVNNCKRASLEQLRNGAVEFRFYPVGRFNMKEAQTWILGLLELSVHAEEMKK